MGRRGQPATDKPFILWIDKNDMILFQRILGLKKMRSFMDKPRMSLEHIFLVFDTKCNFDFHTS